MTQEALKLALEALEKLWNIIDDIDTYGDMAKDDEKLYRSLVERRQRTRFEETGITTDGYELSGGAITAIKEALANVATEDTSKERVDEMQKQRHEQEPVAHVRVFPLRGDELFPQTRIEWKNGKPVAGSLYTTPPQRTWVGLTDEERAEFDKWVLNGMVGVAHAIEAKLKQKNGYTEENT